MLLLVNVDTVQLPNKIISFGVEWKVQLVVVSVAQEEEVWQRNSTYISLVHTLKRSIYNHLQAKTVMLKWKKCFKCH